MIHLVFCCRDDNGLYRTLTGDAGQTARFETSTDAVEHAPSGSGVLILADSYPERTTVVDEDVFLRAKDKGVRLYIEYPAS